MQGVQVRSLVRGLRSHIPRGPAKKKKRERPLSLEIGSLFTGGPNSMMLRAVGGDASRGSAGAEGDFFPLTLIMDPLPGWG